MGAYGSGRKPTTKCTADHLSICVRQWQREDLLTPQRFFECSWSDRGEKIGKVSVLIQEGEVVLCHLWQLKGIDVQKLRYTVALQTTQCHYGGVRYWFSCPIAGCGRRVAKLYWGRIYFGCRHCYKLSYFSQRESKSDRTFRKVNKLRERLDWEAGYLNGNGLKPKGMHWKTYNRLEREHNDYVKCGESAKFKEWGFEAW